MGKRFYFLGFFLRGLASLLSGGVPLPDSLRSLILQQKEETERKVVQRIAYRVAVGEPLSSAMKYERVFPKFVVNLIFFGEETGKLVQNLERAALYLEQAFKLRLKVSTALIYPLFLLGVALSGTFLLIRVFVPAFLPLFTDMGKTLPLPTRFLLLLFHFVSSPWFWGFGMAASVVFFYWYRRFRDRILISLPFFGKAVKFEMSARLTRTLSTAHASGIPLMKALELLEMTMENEVFRSFLQDARLALASGKKLSLILLNQRNLIPPCVGHMVAVAEKTGNLDSLMSKCTRVLEEEIDYRIQRLTRFLEPGILAFMGVQVCLVLLGILSPLYGRIGVLR